MTPWRTVGERDETLGVKVGLSAPSEEIVRVTVSSHGANGAARGSDFLVAAETVLEFQPGELVKTIPLRVLEDAVAEQRELVRFSVSSTENATVGADWADHLHLTWIEDNDISVIDLSPSAQISQEAQTLTIVATRAGGNHSVPLTVPYTVWNSGASAADYSFSSPSFDFAAGQATATVTVQLIDDSLAEAFEGFTVALPGNSNYIAGSAASTYIGIETSDTPTVSLVFGNTNRAGVTSPSSLREANPHGLSYTTVEVIARLSNPAAETISVPLVAGSGTLSGFATLGKDFDLDTSPVVFTPGMTEVIRTLTFYDDLEPELNEAIRVALEPAADQFFLRAGGLKDTSSLSKTLILRDDDYNAAVAGPSSIAENAPHIQYVVSLTRPAETWFDLPIVISGTANRNDWAPDASWANTGYVTFAPGEQTKSVLVRLLDDSTFEGPETLTFQVGRYQSGRFHPLGAVTTTLADNESMPTVSLRHPGFGLTLIDTAPFTIPVDLSAASSLPVTLDVVISGSAILNGNAQISANPGALWIPATTPPPYVDPLQNVIAGQIVISPNRIEGEIRVTLDPSMTGSQELEVSINGGINVSVPDVRPKTTREIIDADAPKPAPPKPTSAWIAGNPQSLQIYTDFVYDPKVTTIDRSAPIYATSDLTGDDILSWGPLQLPPTKAMQGMLSESVSFFDANFNGVADFLDVNENGRHDADEISEPVSTTAANGSFGMLIGHAFDRDGSGRIEAHEGRIVVQGGTDLSTGLAWPIALSAPAGFSTVTPLTTLLEHLLRRGTRTPASALEQVKLAFGLSDFRLVNSSAIHEVLDGDWVAAAAYQQQVSVSSLAIELASFLDGATGRGMATAADEAFGVLAESIDRATGPIDLASPALARSALARLTQSMDTPPSGATLDEIAAVVARGVQRIQQLGVHTFSSPQDFLVELTRIKKVMHGELSTALKEVGAGSMSSEQLAIAYSESEYSTRVDGQQVGVILPPSLGVMHTHVLEGHSGQRMLEFTVILAGEHDGEVRVDYATEDGTAVAGHDYTAQAGTLIWASGDSSPRIVQVPVLGDEQFEVDEYLGLRLTNSVGGVIKFDRGFGYLINDDAFQLNSETTAEVNRITLAASLERVDIVRNGSTISSGELYQPLVAVLEGSSDKPNNFVLSFDTLDLRSDHLTLNGGQQADTVNLRGGQFAGVKHTVESAQHTIVLTTLAGDDVTVNASDIESFETLVTQLDNFLLELPASITDVVIEDADPNASGSMIIRSATNTFAPITLTNPLVKIRIEAASPNATLNTLSTDPAFAGTIEFVVPSSAPTVGISDAVDGFVGVRGQTRAFVLTASSSSETAQAAGFTFTVNWGDGSAEQTLAGPSGLTAERRYATAGSKTISVTATDVHGSTSDVVTKVIEIAESVLQGDVFAIGGTTGNDSFTVVGGNSLTYVLNGNILATPAGAAGGTAFYGQGGTDTVTVQVDSGDDLFVLDGSMVTVNGTPLVAESVENWSLDGLAGNDSFLLQAVDAGATVALSGGPGTDTVTGPNRANRWLIMSAGGGVLYSPNDSSAVTYSGMESLVGGSESDEFMFSGTGAVAGTVQGGEGADKLDYSGRSTAVSVNLQTQTASLTGGFGSIEAFIGSTGLDTLVGLNATSVWNVTERDAVQLTSLHNYQLAGFENLTGGSARDTFEIQPGASITGKLDGGPAATPLVGNVLSYAAWSVPVTVHLTNKTSTNIGGAVTNFTLVMGGAAGDALTGNASLSTILVGGGGNDDLVGGGTTAAARSILFGGAGADVLRGGSADDLLLGARTTHDASADALLAILNEWKSSRSYAARVANILGTTTTGLNAAHYLRKTPTDTLIDDSASDTLYGGLGQDWFLGDLLVDRIMDRVTSGTLTETATHTTVTTKTR